MKPTSLAALAALLPLLALPAIAAERTVSIVNKTGGVVRGIYLSPVENDAWGPDRMGEYNLGHGQTRKIVLPVDTCLYDIRILLDARPEEQLLMGVDLCQTSKVTADGKSGQVISRMAQ